MEALQFPRGTLYLIINKGNEQALKVQDTASHHHSRIDSAAPNPQDLTQLFFVEQVNNDEFEFVNAVSGYCFDEESGEIRLKKGKKAKDQLFPLEKSPIPGFYWIKTGKTTGKALALEGILRYKAHDVNDASQLFRLVAVPNNQAVLSTAVIVGAKSGKAIDIPNSSSEPGEHIIQYQKNWRFNQRWIFVRSGNAFQIRSFLNGFNLDISGESRKPDSKVVQWNATGNPNQLWTVENKGDGTVAFRSVHEPSLVLGIIGDDVNDCGKLAAVNFDARWKIEGQGPK
jgi:hypothetical protein